MTPPAKGRPRQPVPREVRADGQAGALPPHKTINGRRQSSNRNNAHNNSPPPNLHHHLRQRVMDNNPTINYHLGDDISANATQINTKPPSHKRDIIRNHSPSLRSNSEGKEINRSAETNKGWQQPTNNSKQHLHQQQQKSPKYNQRRRRDMQKRRRDGHRGANHHLIKTKGNKSKQGAVGNKNYYKMMGVEIGSPQRVQAV